MLEVVAVLSEALPVVRRERNQEPPLTRGFETLEQTSELRVEIADLAVVAVFVRGEVDRRLAHVRGPNLVARNLLGRDQLGRPFRERAQEAIWWVVGSVRIDVVEPEQKGSIRGQPLRPGQRLVAHQAGVGEPLDALGEVLLRPGLLLPAGLPGFDEQLEPLVETQMLPHVDVRDHGSRAVSGLGEHLVGRRPS
jgi:hypothetical protein